MDFKVGDICWLKPYDEVPDHMGLFHYTWERLIKFPVRIVSNDREGSSVAVHTMDPENVDDWRWMVRKYALYPPMQKNELVQYDTDTFPSVLH